MRLVIGSRKSDLARIQAYAVGDALLKKHPQLKIEYHVRESLGDKNLSDPLWKMPERGVFTEDFHRGLMAGEYDIVVHSWKDLPTEERQGTAILATLPREDMRDVLLLKKQTDFKKSVFKILTSSPRRAHNLGNCLPKLLPATGASLVFESVRGNVQTRVRKLLEGDCDGLIVAKAALDRLLAAQREEFQETRRFLRQALGSLRWMVLPLSLNPTAAAQGALAIEAKSERTDLQFLLESIHCKSTFQCVSEERSQLSAWGGGCHQKIGINIFERPYGKITLARGLRDSGEIIAVKNLAGRAAIEAGPAFLDVGSLQWFQRETLGEQSSTQSIIDAHWVSKAEALPATVEPRPTDLVWASGIKTWLALARRGVWVNGSSESLGEHEPMRISELDGQARQWGKWTHEDGAPFAHGLLLKSYRLVAAAPVPVLSENMTHYFWPSGSAFKQALQHYPWLVDKVNWSGPGHTHDIITKHIAARAGQGAARIAFDLEEWQKLMTQRT